MNVKNLLKKAQMVNGLLGIVVSLVVGVIMLSVVSVITNGTTIGFGGGLTWTIISYIAIGLAITLLVLSFSGIGGKD